MTDLRSCYEEVERAVCDQVPVALEHVPDDVDHRFDAELAEAVPTRPPVVRGADAGSPVELKTCQPTKGAVGTSGQWVFNPEQHAYLDERDGRYLLAVVDEFDLQRWVLCGPADIDPLLGWHDVPASNYDRQGWIRWPVVLGDVSWSSRGRQGRVPKERGSG